MKSRLFLLRTMNSRASIGLALLVIVSPALAQWACPSLFSFSRGRCLYSSTASSYSWCEANLQCALIGGELMNPYNYLMPGNGKANVWVGASDLADERNTSRSGWQIINDSGILPTNDTLWEGGDPDTASQDCLLVLNTGYLGKLVDTWCSAKYGFLCEFNPVTQSATELQSVAWKRASFKRTSYNPSSEYCFKDLTGMPSALSCVAAAGRDANCRRALYNRRTQLCRLLLFTDAQVESEIENSDDWSKFSFV